MTKSVFVDTGYWIALFDSRDQHHPAAKSQVGVLKKSKIVIHEFVLFETITFINASLKNHKLALLFLEFIESLDNCQVVEVDAGFKKAAMATFKKYADKDFSFTDCVSFEFMNAHNITDAYCFDLHFKQMGFEVPCLGV